ncbi:hypothetical protein EWB00_000168 [Schistosoma japonicum]|uniref:Uncharacterized protein n=1 Tax=Schistosoma japonicum TaxID=6182 RepID=A0A4Z2CKK9_SCHJA|nr:hypothetical protein EWB00_000168 [Schistosoma japonicum]
MGSVLLDEATKGMKEMLNVVKHPNGQNHTQSPTSLSDSQVLAAVARSQRELGEAILPSSSSTTLNREKRWQPTPNISSALILQQKSLKTLIHPQSVAVSKGGSPLKEKAPLNVIFPPTTQVAAGLGTSTPAEANGAVHLGAWDPEADRQQVQGQLLL